MHVRFSMPLITLSFALGIPMAQLSATESENIGLRILPAAGTVVVDGATEDWDLSGGIFCCGDVENQRDQFGTWFHAMYDAENLYVLARFVDPTPMNNPGQVEADYGFAGDSLQFRAIVGAGAKGNADHGRGSHWTCWRGRDGKHVMDVAYGVKFDKGGNIKDAQSKGAKQAFHVWNDKQGYDQELAIPWSLIAPDGWKPNPGEAMRLTLECNFTVGTGGRLTNKDVFVPDLTIDRVFTFMASDCWGIASFEKAGKVSPAPVRLSDRREFKVTAEREGLHADWTGLIKVKELAGHKAITFDMPFDGYISLNLFDADGVVARQLLNSAFYTKGPHEVKWDGLSTFSWRNPGDPVPAGTYTWQALVNPGLDMKLVGWAANAGSAPWDGPTGKDNWGGDHGAPVCVGISGDKILLGWGGAEAGKALVACNSAGKVQWKNSRQGLAGCTQVASDGAFVYGVNNGEGEHNYVYRLEAGNGSYAVWPGKDTPDLTIHSVLDAEQRKTIPDRIDALAARDGKLYMAITGGNAVVVCDGTSGALSKLLKVPSPVALAVGAGGLAYVSSNHDGIAALDLATGKLQPFAPIKDVWGIAIDSDGNVYATVRGDRHQVIVFDKTGKELRAIGRKGGRPTTGPWDHSGLRNPRGLGVDATGQVWVAEEGMLPKRFSSWDAKTGAFLAEFFGPTTYGALGGAVCPTDPQIMVGQGCEWRIDPANGTAACLAVINDQGMSNSRFATLRDAAGKDHTYLAIAGDWAFTPGPIWIYERLGDAAWKLRSSISFIDAKGADIPMGTAPDANTAKTVVWSDANGDERRDAKETTAYPGVMSFSGWYMTISPDLTLYSGDKQIRSTGLTACAAPTWDLAKATKMPAAGLGSADGRLVLTAGDYGQSHTRLICRDIASGRQLWWYPDNFVGVHGSHNAPPPEVGLIRGSFNSCGSVKLPEPIGNIWVIPTNAGEWHVLTEKGFYLTRLFQGDATRMRFPEQAVPGVGLNDVPPGMGGEDFGGSITLGKDGKLYLQAGKTAFWDVVVEKLDQVRLLKGSPIVIAPADIPLAQKFKEQVLQTVSGVQRLTVRKGAPAQTGDLTHDFTGSQIATFEKGPGTQVRSAMTWNDTQLTIGWEVQDKTPWVNGARSADALYWGGDSVDLQLATDAKAPADRSEAAKGDLRISIGNLSGNATAVCFRKVATDTSHRTMFSSGVIKEYWMDSVQVLASAKITVTKRPDGYTVEAIIPLAELGIKPTSGMKLKGDLGATFGNQAGDRTRLRNFWSNQHTGLVDDVVFELMLEPQHWGELVFGD